MLNTDPADVTPVGTDPIASQCIPLRNNTEITDAASSPPGVPKLSQAAKKEYNRAVKEILKDLDTVDHALHRIAGNLKMILEKRLYFCGGYTTFADFCQKKLRRSRQHAYGIIRSYDVLQNLLDSGIAEEELPASERICREIRQATLDQKEQAKLWRSLMTIKRQRGTLEATVTIADVQTAARQTLEGEEAATAQAQQQQEELLKKFENVNRSLRVGLSRDVLEPRYRRRFIAVLTDIAETVKPLIVSLQPPPPTD